MYILLIQKIFMQSMLWKMKKYIKYALFAVFGFVVSSVVFTVGNNNTYKVYNNDSDKIKILKNY